MFITSKRHLRDHRSSTSTGEGTCTVTAHSVVYASAVVKNVGGLDIYNWYVVLVAENSCVSLCCASVQWQ